MMVRSTWLPRQTVTVQHGNGSCEESNRRIGEGSTRPFCMKVGRCLSESCTDWPSVAFNCTLYACHNIWHQIDKRCLRPNGVRPPAVEKSKGQRARSSTAHLNKINYIGKCAQMALARYVLFDGNHHRQSRNHVAQHSWFTAISKDWSPWSCSCRRPCP